MKFRALSLGFAAAFGVASMNVAAVVDLNNPTAEGSTVNTYARELGDTANFGTITATFKSTYRVQPDNTIFARVDIHGAKEVGAGTFSLDSAEPANANVEGQVETGAAYTIFEINMPPTGTGLTLANVFTLGFSVKGLENADNGIIAQVRLFNTLTAAQVPNHVTSVAVMDIQAKVVDLKPGVLFSKAFKTSTATVTTGFTRFANSVDPTAPTLVTLLGGFQLKAAEGVYGAVPVGAPAAQIRLDGVFAGGSHLRLVGDMSAVRAAWLTDSLECGSITVNEDGSWANWPGLTPVTAVQIISSEEARLYFSADHLAQDSNFIGVCFQATGNTAMDSSDYNITLVPVTTADYNANAINIQNVAIGEIIRDGATLRSGFVSKHEMQVSRFIFANDSNADSTIYGVTLYDNNLGPAQTVITLPLPYPLKAHSRTPINMADLVDINTMPLQNFMVEFSLGLNNDDVFGTYQLLLNGSNVQTVVPMERLTSAYKK
jgi:hypothetical protein